MVRIEPPEAKVNTFEPTVTGFEPNKKLSWLGVFLMRGIFDGEHKFELTDNGNGTTTSVLQLSFCAKNPRLRQYPKRYRQLSQRPFYKINRLIFAK